LFGILVVRFVGVGLAARLIVAALPENLRLDLIISFLILFIFLVKFECAKGFLSVQLIVQGQVMCNSFILLH